MQSNQFVLITGACGSTGRALAAMFAADGCNLMLVAKSSKELAEMTRSLTQQYRIDIIPMAKDLLLSENADELYKEASTTGIEIGVLVNNAADEAMDKNAAIGIRELFVVRLNIEAMLVLTGHFLKDMTARGHGKILNMAAVQNPLSSERVYEACNWFIKFYTESLQKGINNKDIVLHSLTECSGNLNDDIKKAYLGLMSAPDASGFKQQ